MRVKFTGTKLPNILELLVYLILTLVLNCGSIQTSYNNFTHYKDFRTGVVLGYSEHQYEDPVPYVIIAVKLQNNITTEISISSSEETNFGDKVVLRFLTETNSRLVSLNGKYIDSSYDLFDYLLPFLAVLFLWLNWNWFVRPFFVENFKIY